MAAGRAGAGMVRPSSVCIWAWLVAHVKLLIVLGAMVVLSGALARQLAKPLKELARAADQFALNLAPTPLVRGQVSEIGHLTAIFQTMQERLRARTLEREQAEMALRASEERFRIVQEVSLDGLVILQSVRDTTGAVIDFTYLYLNPAAERVLQQTSDALRGKRILETFPSAKPSGVFDHYRQVAETGVSQEFEQFYDAEGITGWFRNMVVPLGDGIALSFTDITARRHAEEERIQLLEREQTARMEAQEAVHVRDAFLSVASHELRNPLTSLYGTAQILQRRAARENTFSERDQRAISTLVGQAKRLDRMITALMDISHLERGQLDMDRAPVDISALTRRVVDEMRPTLEDHTLSCVGDEAAHWVEGDALRLEQVLQNLLQNAIKYSPSGGLVQVVITKQDEQVCIAISDEGIGIPQDALPNLFRRFFRAGNAETQPIKGLGIGLYVVKELVTLHGGQVDVASVEGQGSTFTICLPLIERQSAVEHVSA